MNKKQLSQEFDVSVTTISRWLELGCPHDRDERGRYIFDPEDVETWRHANIMSNYNTHDSEKPSQKEIAAWGLDMSSALITFIEKQTCAKCRQKFLEHVESGKFHT